VRWFSLSRTLGWLILTPLAWKLGWLNSVSFVSLLSIWALVETAFGAWRSDENPNEAEILKRLDRIEKRISGGNA
jgi:hypothetical protein